MPTLTLFELHRDWKQWAPRTIGLRCQTPNLKFELVAPLEVCYQSLAALSTISQTQITLETTVELLLAEAVSDSISGTEPVGADGKVDTYQIGLLVKLYKFKIGGYVPEVAITGTPLFRRLSEQLLYEYLPKVQRAVEEFPEVEVRIQPGIGYVIRTSQPDSERLAEVMRRLSEPDRKNPLDFKDGEGARYQLAYTVQFGPRKLNYTQLNN